MTDLTARRRNAAATRQAILTCARQAFSELGYDGVGLREIGSRAQVSAMMVVRYFGSKEQLFVEALAEGMAKTTVVLLKVLDPEAPSEEVAEALIGMTGMADTSLQGLQILVRSMSSPRAVEISRDLVDQHLQKAVAAALEGELAAQRAALILSFITGFQVMRQTLGLPAMAETRFKSLAGPMAPLLQVLLTPSQPRETAQAS